MSPFLTDFVNLMILFGGAILILSCIFFLPEVIAMIAFVCISVFAMVIGFVTIVSTFSMAFVFWLIGGKFEVTRNGMTESYRWFFKVKG